MQRDRGTLYRSDFAKNIRRFGLRLSCRRRYLRLSPGMEEKKVHSESYETFSYFFLVGASFSIYSPSIHSLSLYSFSRWYRLCVASSRCKRVTTKLQNIHVEFSRAESIWTCNAEAVLSRSRVTTMRSSGTYTHTYTPGPIFRGETNYI